MCLAAYASVTIRHLQNLDRAHTKRNRFGYDLASAARSCLTYAARTLDPATSGNDEPFDVQDAAATRSLE
jgi:hypothetical protein